jgi:hypothetical protein
LSLIRIESDPDRVREPLRLVEFDDLVLADRVALPDASKWRQNAGVGAGHGRAVATAVGSIRADLAGRPDLAARACRARS